MFNSHCRGTYYREFAHKTLEGVDMPAKDGTLTDLRRQKNYPIRSEDELLYAIFKHSDRPGLYVSAYSYERLHAVDMMDGEQVKSRAGTIDYSSAKIKSFYLDFDCE